MGACVSACGSLASRAAADPPRHDQPHQAEQPGLFSYKRSPHTSWPIRSAAARSSTLFRVRNRSVRSGATGTTEYDPMMPTRRLEPRNEPGAARACARTRPAPARLPCPPRCSTPRDVPNRRPEGLRRSRAANSRRAQSGSGAGMTALGVDEQSRASTIRPRGDAARRGPCCPRAVAGGAPGDEEP